MCYISYCLLKDALYASFPLFPALIDHFHQHKNASKNIPLLKTKPNIFPESICLNSDQLLFICLFFSCNPLTELYILTIFCYCSSVSLVLYFIYSCIIFSIAFRELSLSCLLDSLAATSQSLELSPHAANLGGSC